MRKFIWMLEIYIYICEDYVKNKPERAKDTLEKILFLMQYDSLHEDKKPMLPYKIYIQEDEIRVRYISDMLRVVERVTDSGVQKNTILSWRGLNARDKYVELSRKYKNFTANQIDLRVQKILANETLNSKYFVFKKYEDKWMRRCARIWVQQQEHYIKFYFWAHLLILVIVPIIVFIPVIIMIISGTLVIDNAFITRNIPMFIGIPIIDVFWLIWTKKWTKPTKYELEMLKKTKNKKK